MMLASAREYDFQADMYGKAKYPQVIATNIPTVVEPGLLRRKFS